MVFSSIEFLWLFMPVALGLYLVVPPRLRNLLLALLSLVFYVWGAHAVLFLFLGSISFNFVAGRVLGRLRERGDEAGVRRVMWLAVMANLLVLFTWKYAAFGARQLDAVLGFSGLGGVGIPAIALPIGISFFTFHGISYIVDVARGTSKPMRSLVDYTQYMAFFPQLIAGPIVRYHQIDDQILHPPPRSERMQDLADGFPRFALGLCKKVLIADQVAAISAAAFDSGGAPSGQTAWLGALAYTVQIYFDFSGYSDMAIGMARMFGFRFPENFARPYSSVSLTDFWRRWHMTLSFWFRDYVYIPLGGSRGSTGQTVRNLMLVFAFTGIWHGAAWTFALWGLYHGLLLVGERLTGIRTLPDTRLAIPRRAGTLLAVIVGWVMFRASSPAQAMDFYRAMFSLDTSPLTDQITAAATSKALLALGIGIASFLLPRDLVMGKVLQGRWDGAPLAARFAVVALLPFAAIAVAAGSFSPFLYFRF